MKHYFRTIFHFPGGEIEISDIHHKTKRDAIYEGEEAVDGFSAGAEVMQLAGEEYYEGYATFEVEECWENDDGDIERSESEMF